jgi:hypothetical protein
MKKFRLTLALVMVWLCILTLPAFAAKQDFVLCNATGFTINSVRLSHVSWDKWSSNVLLTCPRCPNGELRDNTCLIINFPDITGRYWDIEVGLANGEDYEFREVDLIDAMGIGLGYRGGRLYYYVVTQEDLQRFRGGD